MSTLLAGAWEYIFGAIGIIGAVLLTWFTGKSKGATEAKAKADVQHAQEEVKQTQAVAEKQQNTIKVVKDVEQTNQSLSDDAARNSMRQSKYHSAD
ncbi:hypothetical protein PZA49_003190 [Salmonella enterica]|nr:hypothetical protein [Salmonella enterica]